MLLAGFRDVENSFKEVWFKQNYQLIFNTADQYIIRLNKEKMESEIINREQAKKWIKETCGDGWLNLVDIIYDNKPEHIIINEVFQKWGALTIRFTGEDELFKELVWFVECISQKMCEKCGLSGEEEAQVGGTTETLCEKHFNEAPYQKHTGEFIEGKTNIYTRKFIDEERNVYWLNKKIIKKIRKIINRK